MFELMNAYYGYTVCVCVYGLILPNIIYITLHTLHHLFISYLLFFISYIT